MSDDKEEKIESNPVFQKAVEEMKDFLDLPVKFDVELGRRMMTLREFLALDKGSIVELKKSAGENMEIYVNGSYFGKAEITVIEDTFGVRIIDINDPRKI